MNRFTHILAAAALALALAVPSSAQAQRRDMPWLLEGYGAYVLVAGDYADLARDGWAAGGLLGYNVVRQVWLMGNFSAYWNDGEGELFDWSNYSYFAMLGYDALAPDMNGDLIFYLGAGAVTFDPDTDVLEQRTYFGLNGGLKLAYNFSQRVAGTLNFAAAVAFSEEDYIGGKTWLFPLGAGLAFRF